jgi:hypothetical protein
MLPKNIGRVRREGLSISFVHRTGWETGSERVPLVGETVHCVEGEAEVVRVCGRVGDGSRLLELRLPDRPKVPFFAASSNVLMQEDASEG